MNGNYQYSNAIAVYKTDKRLIEFLDKLNESHIENYAMLHGYSGIDFATGEVSKIYSNIGIVLQDYSKGKGQNTVRVSVNVSPEDIFWIYNALCSGRQNFEMEQTKIFGVADKKGYSKMTKLRITRSEFDNNGNPRRYQWEISAENGIGIAQRTAIGGSFCKSGTYISQSKAYISLNDYDFFKIIDRVARYIKLFEYTYCPNIIMQGRQAYSNMMRNIQQPQIPQANYDNYYNNYQQPYPAQNEHSNTMQPPYNYGSDYYG